MTRNLKTEAIVLRKKDLLNKDILISLFTKNIGKVIVFAKGVKKITSRRLPHLQTGNLINVLIHKKDDRFYLQESQLISGFSELKKEENKIKYFYLFLFVLDRLLPEQQKEIKAYNLTKNFLIELTKSTKSEVITVEYLTDIMMLLGYLDKKINFPELKSLIEEIINEKLPSFCI